MQRREKRIHVQLNICSAETTEDPYEPISVERLNPESNRAFKHVNKRTAELQWLDIFGTMKKSSRQG